MNIQSHMIEVARACVIAVLLGGCVLRSPSDLHVTSIEVVEPTGSLNRMSFGPLSTDRERWALKVTFASATDIGLNASRKGLSAAAESFRCDRIGKSSDGEGNLGPTVFFDVDTNKIFLDKVHSNDRSKGAEYYLLIRVPSLLGAKIATPGEGKFEDACFYVNQGSVGYAYRSNTVRIPKEDIAAALQRASPTRGRPSP